MMTAHKRFLFHDLDDLAFAAARGKFDQTNISTTYVPQQLGPLLELLHLSAGGRMPKPSYWLALGNAAPFVSALDKAMDGWIAPANRHLGFVRALRRGTDGSSQLTHFLMTAKRAGQKVSGLHATVSGQLVAAMEELENNIHEHAGSAETGFLAYRAEPGAFEFVASDRGVGILRSLRHCPTYSTLSDNGKALEAALTDGVSRHGSDSNRGHGFRPIFTGLMNLYSELRFRSGDHAITMDGTSPTLARARITQKALIDGFFASVRCQASPRESSR